MKVADSIKPFTYLRWDLFYLCIDMSPRTSFITRLLSALDEIRTVVPTLGIVRYHSWGTGTGKELFANVIHCLI